MVNELSELVVIEGGEEELVSRVREAVEWVASKPEGIATLQEAFKLHGKPLRIVVSSTLHYNGYGNHEVHVNPALIEESVLYTQNGGTIKFSLTRFIAHELKHASQLGLSTQLPEFSNRVQGIALETIIKTIPIDKYTHRIDAAMNNIPRLKSIIAEMYDNYVLPSTTVLTQEYYKKAGDDAFIKKFIQEFEVPAIEFENILMHYKNEPPRITDYVKSAIHGEHSQLVERESFIESILLVLAPCAQTVDNFRQ